MEALGTLDLNLLYDVGFNREVGEDGAVYWEKTEGSLKRLIEKVEEMGAEEIQELGEKARGRIRGEYSWERIAGRYEELFLAVE